MRKFLLLCLTALCSLVTQGLWAQGTVSGSIYWPFNSRAEFDETATFAPSGAFSASQIVLGSDLEWDTTSRTVKAPEGSPLYDGETILNINSVLPQSTIKGSELEESTAQDYNGVYFTFTMKEGYTFTPSSVSFYATHAGSSSGEIEVKWCDDATITGSGAEATVSGTATTLYDKNTDGYVAPNRLSSNGDECSYYDISISNPNATTGAGYLEVIIYNEGTGDSGRKYQVGYVTISGTVTTPDGATFELTISPDGTEEIELTSAGTFPTITVTSEGGIFSASAQDLEFSITNASDDQVAVAYIEGTVDNGYTLTAYGSDGSSQWNPTKGETYTLTIPAGTFSYGSTTNSYTNAELKVTYTIEEEEPISINLYTEVEHNVYAITNDASWFAANGFDDYGSDQYSATFDAGTIFYEGENIKIEVATDATYVANFGNKASNMKADFPDYTGYVNCGSTLDQNFTDEVRIHDVATAGRNNQGMLMITPYVDGELQFGVYAGDNQRTIGIYELATEEEIADGTERAWVAINTFKHSGTEEGSTAPDLASGAPGYVSGSVTADRQYLLVGGSNKNLTLHQITFTPEDEIVTEPEGEEATATWDWQNDLPEGISEGTNIQNYEDLPQTGYIESTLDGIELYVDATCEGGKLSTNGGLPTYDYVQMNSGTIVQIPVTSAEDVITVTSYSGQYNYSIGGVAASGNTEVYNVTEDDVTAGYVEIIATGTAYLYSIVADLKNYVAPEPESIGLLDEVEEGVYAITKTYDELMAIDGFSGSDGKCTASFNTGTIFYKDDNIKVEVASDYTYVANNGYQIADIQAIHPDYTAFINFGSQLSSIDETTNPTGQGKDWCGMLKVTPTADGGLTYSLNTGSNTRTLGIYDVEAAKWVTIKSEVSGDVTVYGLVEEGKEYLLVGTGTNSNLYQIAFPADEPEEPVVVEDEVIYTTDFTDWTELDLEDSNGVEITAETTTGEEFTFTLWGVSVNPGDVSQWNTDSETGEKTTPKFEGEGALIFGKYDSDYSTCEPYVLTSTISSVTKIVFTEAVTGSNRGVKISVKGDEDEDWVVVYSTSINSGATEVEVEVNRTNCQIKIESIATNQNTYILDFTIYGVVEEEPVEGELLYSTDFTEWETIDRTEANGDEVTVTTTTGGNLTFTLWGVGVDPTKTDESKFPDYVGAMITAKYAEGGSAEYSVYEPFAVTSTLGTVDKIVFTQVATGNNRGIKVSVKGDGDEDWEVLYNETIHTASGETIELDGINKTNCRIKFESFALAQNGYIADLKIYGTDATGETEDPDEQLYEDIKMDVDALGVDLIYAWANINLEYPESVEGLQSTYDAIYAEITNLQLVVEASHDGEELTADQESIEAQVAIIKEEIAALEAAATSINSITIDNNFEGKSIYTISGQKISAPTKAGIYIIDGKKVVIK